MYKTFLILCFGLIVLRASGQSHGTNDTLSVDQLLSHAEELRQEGRVQETLKSYFAALRRSESTKDTSRTVHIATRLGEYYERYSRPNEAIPYYHKAYELSRHTDSVRTTARLSNSLAWNYHKIKQVDSALRFAEEAVRRHRLLSFRDPVLYAVALESLGEIYSLKGRYLDAEQTLAECMATGINAKNEVIQGFTRYGLAFNCFNQQKYKEARTHILGCLPVAEKYATPEALALVYRMAYQIHDALGMNLPALHYLKAFTTLNDRLQSEDIEKKAAIINANFEIQKKEDELRLLSQQNAIQQLEIEQRSLAQKITIGAILGLIIIAALIYNRIQSQRKFEKKELQRKNEELEQARKVQLSLLPKKPYTGESFDVVGKMITATEVGGDYYDFIKLDDRRMLIAFGDATGHGMTAGMMVTITKVALINNLSLLKDSNDVVPVARAINESILSSVSAKGIGMALQLCIIDTSNNTLSITSCGMPYPMIVDTATGTTNAPLIQQPPLGFMRGSKIELTRLPFTAKDLLVLASDGILERFNKAKEEYGSDRLTSLLKSTAPNHGNLQHLLDAIFLDTETYAGAIPNHDDMTALCARMK